MRAALARIGTIVAAVLAGAVTGSSRPAGSVSSIAGRIGVVGGAVVGVAVPLDIGVELVCFPRPFTHVLAERLGLGGPLVRILAQPRCFDLGLLRVRPCACRLCFPFP